MVLMVVGVRQPAAASLSCHLLTASGQFTARRPDQFWVVRFECEFVAEAHDARLKVLRLRTDGRHREAAAAAAAGRLESLLIGNRVIDGRSCNVHQQAFALLRGDWPLTCLVLGVLAWLDVVPVAFLSVALVVVCRQPDSIAHLRLSAIY